MSFPISNASGFSMTPFGMGTGIVNGTGNVTIGPMGVATSLAGPMPITPANTVNRLGVASPFAQPFGRFNPIQPNSFGQVNPFNPLQVTPYDPFNGAPFGSFGPNQNPLAPTSFMQGGAFSNSLMNPVSMGQQFGATPLGFGGVGGTTQGFAPQPGFIPQQAPMLPPPDTSNIMNFLATGGGSFMMSQLTGGTPGGFGSAIPGQAFGAPPAQPFGANPSFGMPQPPGFGQPTPSFGPVNPFQQQMANMAAQGGAGGRLVSPFGTFITSIGPMGGNANAGFLGAQAAGQASAMVLHPLNPGMIVDFANPFYSSFNFNQGFFAA